MCFLARRTHRCDSLDSGCTVAGELADVGAAVAADDSSFEQHVHSDSIERDARDAVEQRQHSHSDFDAAAAVGHQQRSPTEPDVQSYSTRLGCSHRRSYCWCSQHPARDFIVSVRLACRQSKRRHTSGRLSSKPAMFAMCLSPDDKLPPRLSCCCRHRRR